VTNGAWLSPAAVDFEPYSATVFWITQHDTSLAATPAVPTQVAASNATGPVVITWEYPPIDVNAPGFDPADPLYYSFFYFEVQRNGTTITPVPAPTTNDAPAWSFALRATMWVDSQGTSEDQYTVRAWSASRVNGPFSPPVPVT
jgi:hypothetical protein